MEEVHNKFLGIVTQNRDFRVVEKLVGMGPVELMMQQACMDIELLQEYIKRKWWEAPSTIEVLNDIDEYSKSVDGRPGQASGIMGRVHTEMQRSLHPVHPDLRVWRLLKEVYPNLKGASAAAHAPPTEWSQSRTLEQWDHVLKGLHNSKNKELQQKLTLRLAVESQLFQLAWEVKHPPYRVEKAPWVREVLLTCTPAMLQEILQEHPYLRQHLQLFPVQDLPKDHAATWKAWISQLPESERIRRSPDPFTA